MILHLQRVYRCLFEILHFAYVLSTVSLAAAPLLREHLWASRFLDGIAMAVPIPLSLERFFYRTAMIVTLFACLFIPRIKRLADAWLRVVAQRRSRSAELAGPPAHTWNPLLFVSTWLPLILLLLALASLATYMILCSQLPKPMLTEQNPSPSVATHGVFPFIYTAWIAAFGLLESAFRMLPGEASVHTTRSTLYASRL